MNCTEARKNWMLYLDHEGDPQLLLLVSGHLGHCSDCAEWFARQRRLEEVVRDRLAAGETTPALWARVTNLLKSLPLQAGTAETSAPWPYPTPGPGFHHASQLMNQPVRPPVSPHVPTLPRQIAKRER